MSGKINASNLNHSFLDYYYYSSHNTELITTQLLGSCSLCIIDDFLDGENSIGGCIELDITNIDYAKNKITVSHMCKKGNMDLKDTLIHIIHKYSSYKKTKYPLIINIDASNSNTNNKEFAILWHNLIGECFQNNHELRAIDDMSIIIDGNTLLYNIMGKILFRWGYNQSKDVKNSLYYYSHETSDYPDYLSYINIDKYLISPTVGIDETDRQIDKIEDFLKRNKLVRLFPKTPIVTHTFNYNFAKYMLLGVQLTALNLNLNNKYTLAYNEFFKYDKIIKIPNSILFKRQEPHTKAYSVTVDEGYDILNYYNIFDIHQKQVNQYKHFTGDFNIFNILYIKVKFDSQIYIGCINLSTYDNFDKKIHIVLYKKQKYTKTDDCSTPPQIELDIHLTDRLEKNKILFIKYN